MSAVFSPCRKYRYVLWRKVPVTFSFEPRQFSGNYVQFIGLNPSTADETTDDPTIRKCRKFASRWGFTRMCMTNIFAWRDTDPKLMRKQECPIGDDNFEHLQTIAKDAGLIVAAWGNHGEHLGQGRRAEVLLKDAGFELFAFALSKSNQPVHPLYQLDTLIPRPLHVLRTTRSQSGGTTP